MWDVASGNDGFLSGYKFAVQFRFGENLLINSVEGILQCFKGNEINSFTN